MLKKYCRDCSKVSYSLSAKGVWICPHCAADITDQPVLKPPPCTARILPLAPWQPVETWLLN